MVKSMTGYGKAETLVDGKRITVEVRSLNGKQLDLSVKTPLLYRQLEYEIRNRAAKVLARGKADITVSLETLEKASSANINRELFASYEQAFNELVAASPNLAISKNTNNMNMAIFMSAIRMPEVVTNENVAASAAEHDTLLATLDEALSQFDTCRTHEGEILINDLLHRVDLIQSYKQQIIPYEKARIETITNRIRESVASLGVGVDENRLAQELIFYVEKLDITEEKVRLDKHCDYFRQVVAEEENVGRKLGFIAQEMGREINTLGSKANDSDMQILVVKMKDELEKIKEQVLNIL